MSEVDPHGLMGPTEGSRSSGAPIDASDDHGIDPDSGHSVADRCCPEGEHYWIRAETQRDRLRSRLRPTPLRCCPRRGCGYRLQSILSATDQEVDP